MAAAAVPEDIRLMDKMQEVTTSSYRHEQRQFQPSRQRIADESLLTVLINGLEYATLICSPADQDCLALGFLLTNNVIQPLEAFSIEVDADLGVARVTVDREIRRGDIGAPRLITSGCGAGATFYDADDAGLSPIDSNLKVNAETILALAKTFQQRSKTYAATHGTHSAVIVTDSEIILFAEDISRHNAVDKLFGRSFLNRMPVADGVLLTSGRISFEIVQKAAAMRIPVIASIASPLSLGIKTAEKLGITLVGNIRPKGLIVFTHPQRVISTELSE